MSRVLLVRHGETGWNRARRIQGWAPTQLNDRGREQAAALGATVARTDDVDRILTSDLPRAAETAELVGEAVGVAVERDSRWRERDFGFTQGLSYETFSERFPELSITETGLAAVDAKPESGESFREMFERVHEAWRAVLAETGPAETTLVSTHGGPLYSLLGHLKGLDLAESVIEQTQDNCAVNEVDVSDEPRIVRDNDTDLWD